MSDLPTWRLVLEAAHALDARIGQFRLEELIREVQRTAPERERGSISPVVQGMTVNAGTGPASPCGKPLRRVAHGVYTLTTLREHSTTAMTEQGRPPAISALRSPAAHPGAVAAKPVSVAGGIELDKALTALAHDRPIFHSEADFQLALGWKLQQLRPALRVRLETRPAPGVHLDLSVHDPDTGRSTAIELKYPTRAWSGTVHGERYELKDHGAQDITGYDIVRDICRVERFVQGHQDGNGAVVVITNDAYYWRPPAWERETNAAAFRVHDGTALSGLREWGPRTGVGTMRGREAALQLLGSYPLRWCEYSTLPSGGPAATFRCLIIGVAGVD